MEHNHEMDAVVDRVVLTPAERAVLSEQCEALNTQLAIFLKNVREGTAPDCCHDFRRASTHWEYITNILNTKVQHVVENDHHREGM